MRMVYSFWADERMDEDDEEWRAALDPEDDLEEEEEELGQFHFPEDEEEES